LNDIQLNFKALNQVEQTPMAKFMKTVGSSLHTVYIVGRKNVCSQAFCEWSFPKKTLQVGV